MTHEAMKIASEGRADCVILTQPGATAAERHAAGELASHIEKITGAEFPMRQCADAAPASAIIIGPGPLARKLFPEVELASFGGERLALRTKGGRLLLAGGRPRGTLYAVYRFLHEHCGVRWWTPWASRIPARGDLAIGPLAIEEEPAFEYRDPFCFPAFDGDCSARNACNGFNARLGEQHGGKVVYKGFVHTFFPLVPPDEHFGAHPEWFSMIDGQRRHPGGHEHKSQLCTTNPQLRDFIVERVRQWLRESPDAAIVSVSQDDTCPEWSGACQCPACKAVDDREGSHAGTMIELVNYVAAKLAGEFLEGYYGPPAAGYIGQYMALLHKAATGVNMVCYAAPNSPYLRFEVLSEAEGLWQKAQEAAKDDPDRLWRVKQGHLAVRYAFLANWAALRGECLQAGAEWPLPPSRKAIADDWLATATGPGPQGWTPMTHVNEGGLTPQAFVAGLANEPE